MEGNKLHLCKLHRRSLDMLKYMITNISDTKSPGNHLCKQYVRSMKGNPHPLKQLHKGQYLQWYLNPLEKSLSSLHVTSYRGSKDNDALGSEGYLMIFG